AVNGWGFRRSDHRSGDEKAEHKQPPSVLAPARADRSLGERFPRRLPCPMVEQWCSPGEPSNPVRSGSSPGRSWYQTFAYYFVLDTCGFKGRDQYTRWMEDIQYETGKSRA